MVLVFRMVLLFFVIFLVACSPEPPISAPPPWGPNPYSFHEVATVRFFVVDIQGRHFVGPSGREEAGPLVLSFQDNQGQEWASHFHALRATDIPVGQYKYRLVATRDVPGATSAEGVLAVYHPEQWQTVTLFPYQHDITLLNYYIGRLNRMPSGEGPVWVRLQSLFRPETVEASVDSSGTFRIAQPLVGPFLLLVFHKDQLIHLETLPPWRPGQILTVTLGWGARERH